MHSCGRHLLNTHCVYGTAVAWWCQLWSDNPGWFWYPQSSRECETHFPIAPGPRSTHMPTVISFTTQEQKEAVHLPPDHSSCLPTSADLPQHREGNWGRKPGRDVPKFPQQVHGIVRPRTQLSEYHSCITSFPLSHSGLFKEERGPKYPGHKLWHGPKIMFTAVMVILITPNVYSMWLDFLYSPSISKFTWQSSLHFLPLTISCFISPIC